MALFIPPTIDLAPAYPEVALVISASAILLIDMFVTDARRILTYRLSVAAILLCAALTAYQLTSVEAVVYTFGHMFVADPLANLLKLATYLTMLVSLIYSRDYLTDSGIVSGERGGEFYVLALFSMLGQMVMISATNFLPIYLGLELMSLALYAMVALKRDNAMATEASMKYFLLGAISSGFLLYGMSMIYGATGSLDLGVIEADLAAGGQGHAILVFGLVFIVAGLAFKIGVVPFHMWIPDVYQGAPTAVTLMIGGAPKLAAFAITFRILIESMLRYAPDWQEMLVILAVLSLALGNITAIAQTSMKRLLGYSTIAQMGFMLLGLLSGVIDNSALHVSAASSSALFYVLTYTLTAVAAFGVLLSLSRRGYEADRLDDFKGLAKRDPLTAFIMMVIMFSLAGVPPTVGFYAKFVVVNSVVVAGMTWLAVFAVMMSLIGAFYYLRVIKLMYFDAPAEGASVEPLVGDFRVALVLNGVAVAVLGLLPGGLIDYCLAAITRSLAS